MTNLRQLEQRLWDAADELRANSKLKASEYSIPVLGLIFLRYADYKFGLLEQRLSKTQSTRRKIGKADFQAEGVLYLPPEARFNYLLHLAEGQNIAKAINDAMKAIEADNEDLKGVLPRTYAVLDNSTLAELLKLMASIPMDIEGDAFGRIYEYFLGEFAMTEGQKGGEFFTPTSIVQLIVQIIEPFHGRIYDPACGSGGMFVQSAHFVESHRKNPNAELSLFGQEKTTETVRLCKMNLAVHGLSGDIREANSYYEDLHKSVGKFDFVMANPPFNVDRIDKSRLKDDAARFPLGMPNVDNGNYLWIQLFASALSKTGRAGFVMANSASDARNSEMDIRRRLIESGIVDVIVSVGPNMFYTVTLPCMLWFLDKRKPASSRSNEILFIDATHTFEQVDRSHRTWTPTQIGLLANIVRLYRGDEHDFTIGGADSKQLLIEKLGSATEYRDAIGLCKVATLTEVAAHSFSLNPGRYVGVAHAETLGEDDLAKRLTELHDELTVLNAEAYSLQQAIDLNVAALLDTTQ
jgi:type I restriction enzyme M protein